MPANPQKYIYVITSNKGRTFWTKIGVAFVNRDGSLNCKLNCLPITGELHIRDAVERADARAPDGSDEERAQGIDELTHQEE